MSAAVVSQLILPKFTAYTPAGLPATGYKLWTYAAGTSTPQATYTDSTGLVANSNPAILNANGQVDVWCTNLPYKFVLQDPTGVQVWVEDNVTMITPANLASYASVAALASTAAGQGDALVAGKRTEANSIPFTLDFYNQNRAYNAVVDGGLLTTNTASQNKTALDNAIAANNAIYIPGGTYNLNALAPITHLCQISMDANTILNFTIPATNAGAFVGGQTYTITTPGTTAWDGIGASVIPSANLIPGKDYVIATPGTTNWVACGSANGAAGTIFTATAAQAGTGTAWERNFVATFVGTGTGTAVGGAIQFNCGDTGSILRGGGIIVNSGGAKAAFAVQIQGQTRNFLVDRVNFVNSVVSYCVDHQGAYGLRLHACTFGGITGSGIRLRSSSGASPYYSYVTDIDHCDFTGLNNPSILSGIGLEIEGGSPLGPINVRNSVFENCVQGVACNTNPGGGYTWNLHLDGCYIENIYPVSAGMAISLNNNGNANGNLTHCKMTSCYIQGNIDLGAYGSLIMESCTTATSNLIYGSGVSVVFMFECPQLYLGVGWSQSGTFTYLPQGTTQYYVPTVTNIPTGTALTAYSISGRTVTCQVKIPVTGGATGGIAITLPVYPTALSGVATLYSTNPIVGSAYARVGGSTFYMGAVEYLNSTNGCQIVGNGTAGGWGVGVPGVWASGDYIYLDLCYQI